jgi:shikimate dehydrogenase
MQITIQGTTRVYGIIGWPVGHSRSPQMQNAAFQALGMDCVYVPFAVPPHQLAEAVQGLRSLGVAGWNVTIPHKSAIMPFLDQLSPEAVRAGAVNTVCNQDGRLIGYNTDGAGLLISLERDLDCPVVGKRIMVLGAGGAARGAVAALAEAGATAITVVNRTLSAASQLAVELHGHVATKNSIAVAGFSELPTLLPEADLLINATSLGLHGEEIAGLDLALLPATAKVYDMVYGVSSTPLVRSAHHQGLLSCDGLGMLAAQGELAFYRWTGVTPPIGLMAKSLQQER